MDFRHADNPTPFSKMRAERQGGAKVLGVVRFKENPRALAVIFEQVPSDDDLRRIHDLLRSNGDS